MSGANTTGANSPKTHTHEGSEEHHNNPILERTSYVNGRSFKLFTVFGMPIRIHVTWFVVVALITWSLAVAWFPYHGPLSSRELPAAWHWVMAAVSALLLFVSVLLHELGHSFLARHHRIPVRGITLFFFGGVAEIGEEPKSPRAEVEVTLGGLAVSATLAVVALLLLRVLPTTTVPLRALAGVIHYMMFINLVVLIFNTVPGFPLDGGRLLRALLWWTTGNLRRATYVASSVGSGVGLVLIILGVFIALGGDVIGGVWFALIGAFLRSAARNTYQQLLLRRALEGVPIRQLMTTNTICVPAETPLREAVDDWFLRYHDDGFAICGPEGLEGMLTLDNVRAVKSGEWQDTTVGEAMDRRAPGYAVPPDMDAMHVLARMSQLDVGCIPVVQDGRLVGIVTRRDLLELLRLKTDLEELQGR